MDAPLPELLDVFKALADANRLKIVGLLAREAYTVEQLAEILGLSPSTVSHHLSRLSRIGLVSARAEGYYSVYRLETEALEALSQRLLSRESVGAVTADMDLDAYDRKVIDTFCDADGRIRQFPAQRKKLEVLLRHVRRDLEPGVRYPEARLNGILKRYSDDTATLRRAFIDHRLMEREGGGGDYWLTEAGAAGR